MRQDPALAALVSSVLAVASLSPGCGSAPEPLADPAPTPPASTSLRVRSAGVAGEYPLPDDVGASLTLHLIDGDVATAWRPTGVARLEVDAGELRWIEILQTGIQRVRWRPLPPRRPARSSTKPPSVSAAEPPSRARGAAIMRSTTRPFS